MEAWDGFISAGAGVVTGGRRRAKLGVRGHARACSGAAEDVEHVEVSFFQCSTTT
jgi:hypothetical protein